MGYKFRYLRCLDRKALMSIYRFYAEPILPYLRRRHLSNLTHQNTKGRDPLHPRDTQPIVCSRSYK